MHTPIVYIENHISYLIGLQHNDGVHRNIMQIVWLVIPGVGPGYRGAGPWPGVGVPQQRRAPVAAVARP